MIDTIRGNLEVPFSLKALAEAPEGWEYTRNRKTEKHRSVTTHLFYHKDSGLRLHGRTWMNDNEFTHEPKYTDGTPICTSVEVAMPRLIHESNSVLISDEDMLHEATSSLKYRMQQVLEYDQCPIYTRVDLVWQFRGNMVDYINSFRSVRHPNIRGGQIIYEGETIQWKGHRLDILMYDKLKEKGIKWKQDTSTVRVEVRLRNQTKNIQEQLTKPCIGGRELDFEKCYTRYRETLLQLEPKAIETYKKKGAYEVLAYVKAHGVTDHQGRPLLDMATQNLTRSGRYAMIKKLEGLVAKHRMVTFRKLLPEQQMPEVVNVYAQGKNESVKVA